MSGSSSHEITLRGRALHSGVPSSVRFVVEEGPVRLRFSHAASKSSPRDVAVDELVVADTRRATTVATADGEARLATVEHLFAALAAASVRRGLVIEVDAGELPFLDGASASFLDAIRALALPPAPPTLDVVRAATIEVGGSRYTFAPASASSSSSLGVTLDFPDARLAPDASWEGDRTDFAARIASARTFAFVADLDVFLEAGLASHVSPSSVVVFTPDRILASGAPFAPDEPARHKLLDLAGDLYLYGGPPLGRIHAFRPGHAATHAVIAEALATGVVARHT